MNETVLAHANKRLQFHYVEIQINWSGAEVKRLGAFFSFQLASIKISSAFYRLLGKGLEMQIRCSNKAPE